MSELLVKPDRQRRAADPAHSSWVAASAGTGKTSVLVDRIQNLLLNGTAPQKILCLTFTKAAAKEMVKRLMERLGQWVTLSDADLSTHIQALSGAKPDDKRLERARRLFADVLDAPGGLRIDTIHAFCQALLQRFPLEANLPPHFQVMEERGAAELLRACRDEVLSRARGAEGSPLAISLEIVTARTAENEFNELMNELVHERGRLERLLRENAGVDGLIFRLREELGLAADTTEMTVLAAASEEVAFDGAGLRRAADALLQGSVTDRKIGAWIAAWLAAPLDRIANFDLYRQAYFTTTGERRKTLVTKETLKAAPGVDTVLAAEAERLQRVQAKRNAAHVADASAALIRLGDTLIRLYDRAKRLRAALDYDDLILKARDLLKRKGVAPWVLYKLDGGIDHILIDEAQDTNPEQWEVIGALAEDFFAGEGASDVERTVFAVGDPKQSIFSFQRADPRKFREMRDYFEGRAKAAAKAWAPVDLNLSFRSTEPVLNLVDAVFAQPEARRGVAFDEHAIAHDSHRRGAAGLVELWPPVRPQQIADPAPWAPPIERVSADEPAAVLAQTIARSIRGWIDSGEILESRGRPIRASDVMILVRRRNRLVGDLVRALKREKIEVAGVDRMVLPEQMAVMDLVALGRFLLLPEDDLTLATVLKGPLFGLSEEQLFDLAHPREGRLWAELRRRAGDDPAYARAFAELSALLGRVDYVRPFELYAEILGARGGKKRLLARLGPEAEDPIEEFLAAALSFERAHPPALETFLHWLDAGREEIKRDLEAVARDEVRIMTVHGAKGLQAPIVFLPDTMQVPTKGPRVLWTDNGTMLWCPRSDRDDPCAATARGAAKAQREEEYRRLLYVALTRAEDRLYVCGYETERAAPATCWYNLVAPVFPAQKDAVEIAAPEGLGAGWRRAQAQAPHVALREELVAPRRDRTVTLPVWWNQPAPAEPASAKRLVPSAGEGEPPVRSPFGADDGYRFRRGTLIHRLLQTLPELPVEARPGAAARFLERRASDLDAERRAALAEEALAVLNHPEFGALFGPGSIAEAPIVGPVKGRAISGQIDRLLVRNRDVLVLDYKTNRPPPLRVEDVAPVYLTQMAAYRAALRQVYPGRTVRCALLWTDGPRLMELPSHALDAAEAAL